MKYIVVEEPGFTVIAPDAVLYERIESSANRQEVPLAPRYRKVASGKSGQLQKLAKKLNTAEGQAFTIPDDVPHAQNMKGRPHE